MFALQTPSTLPLPRWALMWIVAWSLYAAAKLAVWSRRRRQPAPLGRHLAFLFAWPGMDVEAFLHRHSQPTPTCGEWLFALAKMTLGLLLILLARRRAEAEPLVVGSLGMWGVVFTLHFGLFHWLSCLWRSRGIDAPPIMQCPPAARSLAEFWGKRWNLAFHELTVQFLFRPLRRRVGATGALCASFLVSGLVHDLVISLPAGGGYGLPTIYFLLQGGGLILQRGAHRAQAGRARQFAHRLFAATVVTLPLPLLFHPWFVAGVMAPFVRALRSWS